jgi:hypothetical protein
LRARIFDEGKLSRLVEAAFAFGHGLTVSLRENFSQTLFNTMVNNSVEKMGTSFASDSARDASTFCTRPGAGTLGLVD